MTLRSLFGRAASTLLILGLAACGGGGGGDAPTFTVGGTVTGLAAGTQIVLNNGGNDPLTVSANSTFVFSKTVPANGSYLVTITTQPVGQTCSVANFQGAGVTANVTNVNVTCSAVTHTVGGTVSGLAAGQQVTLNNNGADALAVGADGVFTFATPVAYNGSYAVTVGVQPTGQTCTVSSGSGAGVVANISDVAVTCSTNTFTVGGAVTGLASGQQVTLNNNTGDPLTVTADGSFTFATPVAFNGGYAVTVGTQPTGQTCSVSNGTGAGVTANVANVAVTCSTNTFTIGGTVTGLAAGQQVTLNNNAGDPLTVTADGSFTFTTPVNFNGSYAVTVGTQPTGQTCSVSNGTGSGVTANVSNANVTCSTNTFTIGGTVSGLAAGQQVTLYNNGGNAKIVAANGAYTFTTPVNYNGSYAVTVNTQPTGQTCSVSNGTGSNVSANVGNANITCSTNTYTIGGTVSGLAAGQQVTLFNNGGDAKTVTADGAFTFTTPVNYNGSYAVTVSTQPTGETCRITNGTGSNLAANVTSVSVNCRLPLAYVTNKIDNTVSQFKINLDGTLTSIGAPVNTGVTPNVVTVDPTGRFAYVANFGDNPGSGGTQGTTVSQYLIDATTGALTPNGTATTGLNPYSIAIDPTGQYAYVTNQGAGTVSQFTINANGTLSALGTPVATGSKPYQVTIDPTGKYVYVANLADAGTVGGVSQYTISGTGELVPMSPALVSTTTAGNGLGGAIGVAVNPAGTYAYVTNLFDKTITRFSIGGTGALTPVVEAAQITGTTPYPMSISPDGQHAFWSNKSDYDIQPCTFAVSGQLACNGGDRLGAIDNEPQYMAVDPFGRYVYAVSYNAGGPSSVTQFAIGAGAGVTRLSPTSAATGNGSFSITTTR